MPEECSYLHVPSVTVRDSSERPELIEAGATILSGTDKDSILRSVEMARQRDIDYPKSFDLGVSDKVLKILVGVL